MVPSLTILEGDALEKLRQLPSESVHCCVTSPPYWGLRDYSTEGQLGLEKTPQEYVAKMVEIFHEVRGVLRKDGTLWLNLGSSYAGGGNNRGNNSSLFEKQASNAGATGQVVGYIEVPPGFKPKDMVPIPWMVAMALQADGWYLRSDIIWSKPNPMPESVTDRPTKSHEYLFLLTKSPRYFYDYMAICERAQYAEEHARKSTSWGPNGKMAQAKIGKSNHENYLYTGENHTSLPGGNRNKRSVWTVATAPFSDWTETVRWKRVEVGVRGDGTRRIVSPNSVADGGLFDLLATVLYDEHEENSLTDICDICNRLSLEPRDGYVPSEKLGAYYFGDENLDSFLHRRLGSAIRRNNGTNKTGLFVATSLACKPSVGRSCRIARILEIHGWSEQDRDMLLNNTWPDDWPVHLWEQTLYHIGDNASREGMYRKASEMTSHFACYPPDLIKPCILAGTSARGCCAKCGAPWERITEGEQTGDQRWSKNGGLHRADAPGAILSPTSVFRTGSHAIQRTLGWQPTCGCCGHLESMSLGGAGTIPCTILDPFAGSGTTGAVALELGRRAILIELNPKYVELIEQRCNTTLGLALA